MKFAITTLAIGRSEAGHTLPDKINLINEAGFEGVEISIFCLTYYAAQLEQKDVSSINYTDLKNAALQTRSLIDETRLEVLTLSPLMNYDSLIDRSLFAQRFEQAKEWLEIAHILKAKCIQLPATMLCEIDSIHTALDLKSLALAAQVFTPMIDILWEFTSWSTHVKTWQQAAEVIRQVEEPNLSLCIDTFHMTTLLCRTDQGPFNVDQPDAAAFRKSLQALEDATDLPQIGLFQLSNAQPYDESLQQENTHAFQTWSRNLRNFPCEEDGIFPIMDICRTMHKIGYTGYWSFETFDRMAWDPSPDTPKQLLQRALKARAEVEACLAST